MSLAKDRVAKLDEAGLRRLEVNARRQMEIGTEARREEAAAVLASIDEERIRRSELERREVAAKKKEIEAKTRDLGLFDRVCLAFTEVPPIEWETEMLRAVADNPGSGWDVLARAAGKRKGSYVNLAVGSLCAAREPYLVTQEWLIRPQDKRWYSEFIIDFTHEKTDTGDSWSRWTLKPEAEAALRHLRII